MYLINMIKRSFLTNKGGKNLSSLKEEFLALGNFHPDPEVFNPNLRQ